MLDIQSLTNEIERLNQSVQSWNNWVIGGMAATAIAAFFLVVFQLKVNGESRSLAEAQDRLLKLKDERLTSELSDKDVLIAKAMEGAAEANERAAKAEERAAEANTKSLRAAEGTAKALAQAATLEKEAADAKLEAEKLKAIVAWRSLAQNSLSAMMAVLSANPGSVNLRWMDGDPEALYLAMQILNILEKSHWNVARGSAKYSSGIVFGVVLSTTNSVDGQTLGQALTAGKLQFATGPLSRPSIEFNNNELVGAPILTIGSKRPAFP